MATAAPMKREMLYAPSAPFAEAIEEWQAAHRKRWRGIGNSRTPQGTPVRSNGIEALAGLSRIPSRRLRAYTSGESMWISIDNADRLCIALNVALWVLAPEFKTMGEWRKEESA
jgi:hypothetical protein